MYPYTEKKALDGISYEFNKGVFYGIIGQNGGGKTTLCNVVRGLIPHFYHGDLSGDVIVDGTDVREWDTGDLPVKIGYVFQNPFTQISGVKETVFEEIAMGLENLGVEKKEIIRRVIEVSEKVNVNELLEKNPNALSGGQRQRVAFASIIIMDPEMLIIDEPTSQLDPRGTEDVFKIIDTLKQNGKTIILVEHKINLIARYCDELIVMKDGKIIANDKTAKVLTDPGIRENGVNIPDVTKFGYAMERANKPLDHIPITVDETVLLISNMQGGNQSGN
jgi:energy-coupling factor transport system ATP-binding protein